MKPFEIARKIEAEAALYLADVGDEENLEGCDLESYDAGFDNGYLAALYTIARKVREWNALGLCPGGDQRHWSDTEHSETLVGLCSDCELYWDEMRKDWIEDQMKAFPKWMQY